MNKIDISNNLNLLSTNAIDNKYIPKLDDAIQLCYEYYRIMDIRDKLINNFHKQKSNYKDNSLYKSFLLLNNKNYTTENNEYNIIGHAIYNQIRYTLPNNRILQQKFKNITIYDNNNFRYLLENLNLSISLPIMNYSSKPFLCNDDKKLIKSWTIMLHKFILKLCSSDKNINNISLNTLELKINNIIKMPLQLNNESMTTDSLIKIRDLYLLRSSWIKDMSKPLLPRKYFDPNGAAGAG